MAMADSDPVTMAELVRRHIELIHEEERKHMEALAETAGLSNQLFFCRTR